MINNFPQLYNILFMTKSHTVGPPNTTDLGTDEKTAVFGNRRYSESYITYKTLIWDLEMGGAVLGGGGIGGGGIGRGGIGGDD